MNSFADSPFLFFFDNVPPVSADNSVEGTSKIIELFDVGCDARTSIMMPQNNNQYHPLSNSKMKEGSKMQFEEKPGNKIGRERLRQTERVVTDMGKLYPVPKEEKHIPQCHWEKPSIYGDVNDNATFRRTPKGQDIETNAKFRKNSPERTRTRRWYKYNFCELHRDTQCSQNPATQNFQKETVNSQSPARKRPKPSLSIRANYPKVDSSICDQELIIDREKIMVALEPDYPEVLDVNISEDDGKNLKISAFKNSKNKNKETLQKSQKSSRNHKPSMISHSVRQNNAGKRSEDSRGSRIRSRTCSPPSDRQKKTQSLSKPCIEDLEQAKNQENVQFFRGSRSPVSNAVSNDEENVKSASSSEKIKRFVNRAVDKDCLPDTLDVSTSHDVKVAPSPSISSGKCEEMTGIWEFISLDDENDQEDMKIIENRGTTYLLDQKVYLNSNGCPLTLQLMNDEDIYYLKTKEENSWKNSLDTDQKLKSFNVESCDPSSELNSKNRGGIRNEFNPYTDPSKVEERLRINLNIETTQDTNESELNLDVDTITKVDKYPENGEDQSRGEPSNQQKLNHKFAFEWSEKYRLLKGYNDITNREIDVVKQNEVSNRVLDDTKTALNILEKTAACLTRKLGGPKTEEMLSECLPSNMEKTIRSGGRTCSKLPIRIGSRLRSKNPITWRFRANSKGRLPDEAHDKGPEVLSSIKSRTKPRIKPSVEHHKIVVDSTETSVNLRSMKNVRTVGRTEKYLVHWGGEPRLMQNNDVNELTNDRNDDKLEAEIMEGGFGNFKGLNVEQHSWKRNFVNRSYGREPSHRNRFKGKCFFELNNENVGCRTYCNKNSLRLGNGVPMKL